MSQLLHKCTTKATTLEGDGLRCSFDWGVSRRGGSLEVLDDALKCGNWRIPYDTIDESVLLSMRQMLIPCYILRVAVGGTVYEFGLKSSSYWKGELPFPVVRERMRRPFSSWSVFAVYGVLLAYFIYVAWKRFW